MLPRTPGALTFESDEESRTLRLGWR